MSVIFHNRGGVLTIQNGTFKHLGGTDMAFAIDNSGNWYGDATTNIQGGTLSSTYTAIRNRMEENSHGASGKAILNISGGSISGTTIAVWAQAASTSTTAPATGEINVSGGSVGLINTARSDGAECMTTISVGTVAAFKGEAGELTVKGSGAISGTVTLMDAAGKEVGVTVTEEGLYIACEAKIGDKPYTTLAEAIEDAVSGDTVKLLQDIELTEAITVPAGKSITLDMNGKTISQSKACTESYAMINNKGNLTITGNGKLSFTDTSAGDLSFGWGSYTVRNEGTLVVENGTIEHLGAQAFATHCIQAIFQYSGSTTINGGTISTPNYRSVRLWKGSMTINGGTFEGQVWVQCVDNSAKMAINGGSFSPKGNDGSSVFVGNSEYEAELSVTGGNFATKIGANDAASLSGSITGGTFTETAKNGTNEVLLNKDFKFRQNANGTYGITAKDYVANIGTTKKYESLQEAVDGAADGETITLLADVTLTAGITADKNLTIDANGHAIKGSNVTLKPASGKTLRLIGLGTNAKLGVDLSANDTATADADGVITVATAGTEYGSMTLLSKDTQTEIISSRKVFVASGTKLVIKSTSTGFDKNTFNGEYMLDMPNKDKVYSATLNADDLYTEYRNYENIYVRGTNNTLTVVSSAFFDTCKRIYVDNSTVYHKETNYSMANVLVARGCTELEMKSGFLTTLATGKHTVKFVHMIDTNGDGVKDECVTTAEFWVKSSGSVADPTCPKTGDYIMIAVGVLGVSVAALAVLLIIRKKKS